MRSTLFAIVICLAACASNNTGSGSADETAAVAFQRVGQAACSRLQQCFPDGFAKAYGTESACEDKWAMSPGANMSGSCPKTTVDACVNALSVETCPADPTMFPVPKECGTC